MSFGDPGTVLISELKQQTLLPYNHTSVAELDIEQEKLNIQMNDLKSISEHKEITTEVSINFMILKRFYERNARIKNVYVHIRHTKILDYVLENNNVFKKIIHVCNQNNENGDKSVNMNRYRVLSSDEYTFVGFYKNLLVEYVDEFEFLDFDVCEPPLNFFVTIMTHEECGILLNGDEIIELRKNKIYYLRRKLVEHLIESEKASEIKT